MENNDQTDENVAWLDDKEREAFLSLVGVIVGLPAALDAQLRKDSGISHFEYLILAILSSSEGETLRMKDLASAVHSSLSRLSHACSRLEQQDWIVRTPEPGNARTTLARLTDTGRAKLVRSAPGHVGAVRRYVFDPLTRPQVLQLGRIANLITDAIGPVPA